MKKIFLTLSLICFVAFLSNAQTAPTGKVTAGKEVKTETVKTEASATTEAKKPGCCRKGMSSADCKTKNMKNCSPKASADAKTEKASAKEANIN